VNAYELEGYIPRREWFDRQEQREWAGTHGIGHITRVLVWSAAIAGRFDRPLRRPELLWAAGLHDVKRWTDGRDHEHGQRAAGWVLAQFPSIRPDVAAGVDLELVATLCRDHVSHDDTIAHWTDELRVLKDADGLERVRINDLDSRRLRLSAISPPLEAAAWALMRASVARGNTADAVRETALQQGLWR
jgi:hypothetical protein